MKLHFDPNQQFQLDAINSVVGIFEGQSLNHGDFDFSFTGESLVFQEGDIGNRLTLGEEQILENVKAIQERNELAVSDKLDGMNFSVEMETGTGKTVSAGDTLGGLSDEVQIKETVRNISFSLALSKKICLDAVPFFFFL